MSKILNVMNRFIDSIGLIYGIANIQEILGVIVLVLTIINIVTSYAFKIYDKIKAGDYKGANEELTKAIDEISDKVDEQKNK